jgi:phosphoribosylaminoimidazole (AIR) synthetase
VHDRVAELGVSVAEALLGRTARILPVVRPLLDTGRIKGMAHITGGGITDNLPRVLPRGTEALVRLGSWEVPPIFRWLERAGAVPQDDMLRTFNMGVGLILVVAAARCRRGDRRDARGRRVGRPRHRRGRRRRRRVSARRPLRGLTGGAGPGPPRHS